MSFQSDVLLEHRAYLGDAVRLRAYGFAIAQVVHSGDVVVDLGAGTGILGLLAARAGAAEIISIEASSLIGVARDICRANPTSSRFTFVKAHSLAAEVAVRADVVLADQVAPLGFEARIVEVFTDARKRFLRPGGLMVPGTISLFLAPVETAEGWQHVSSWEERPEGFDVTPFRAIAANTFHHVQFEKDDLLGEPALVASFDPSDAPPSIGASVRSTITRAGTLHGLAGWFSAELAPGIAMSNSPEAAERINRKNVYLPIAEPIGVTEGDVVSVEAQVFLADPELAWRVTASDASGRMRGTYSHSTMLGNLIAKEDLERSRPDHAPALSPTGRATRDVLELCDGFRPVAEIEAEVLKRHQDVLVTEARAAAFVAAVLGRHTR